MKNGPIGRAVTVELVVWLLVSLTSAPGAERLARGREGGGAVDRDDVDGDGALEAEGRPAPPGRATAVTDPPMPEAAFVSKVCSPPGASTVTEPVVRLRLPPSRAVAVAFAIAMATAAPMPDADRKTALASPSVVAVVEFVAWTSTEPARAW